MTDQPPPPPPYGGPPQYGQQPPGRKRGGCGKAALIGLAVFGGLILLVIIVAIVGAGSEDDDGDTATDTTAAEDTATETTGAEETESPQPEGEADEVDDARISECTTDPTTGWMLARVEVTNNSSGRSTYFMDVAFESPGGGEQLATSPVVINDLEPDQTTTADAMTATEAPGGEGSFECRIVDLDRMSAG